MLESALARRPDVLEDARASIATSARGKIVTVSCDVSKADEIVRAHAAVMERLGRIDIVVNNAGTSRTGTFESITDEIWQEDLDLKLFAAVRLIRLAWTGMKERRWGRVINVLNIGAKAPRVESCPTVVSRAAGMALSKVLAGEGAPHGILVNALLVGQIVTEQVKNRHRLSGTDESLEEFIAKTGIAVPLGRMGTAEEFANVACFLASDNASYVTGTAINVDGGSSPVV
jgi:3-oxoacyl-[acyl-carrier protein] reductase